MADSIIRRAASDSKRLIKKKIAEKIEKEEGVPEAVGFYGLCILFAWTFGKLTSLAVSILFIPPP